jgi:DNA-3-methyladenine glycosylase
MKLPRDFYERPDVVAIARELTGKVLCNNIDGHYTAARITELEAYAGRNDKACHANDGLRTNRTEAMYGRGGTAYVYLCYGIHHLFNVVTNREGLADAILIRSVEPLAGLEVMMDRRNKARPDKTLSSGPGTLSQALGIKTNLHYGLDLLGNTIWIEDAPQLVSKDIVVSTRIGVDYAEEDALKPWRFYVRGSKWVSKKLTGDR